MTTICPTTALDAESKLTHLGNLAITALAAALTVMIAWFDYVTGDFSMAVLYLLPVALAAWYAGQSNGWCIAILSAAGSFAGDMALSHTHTHRLLPFWNAAALALIYGVVVQLLSSLQRFQSGLESMVAERTAALATANAELLAVQMSLIEAEKLESIGRLAAGVAHEVKNPLMTITMVGDYLAPIMSESGSEGSAMVQDLREAVARANRVINEMLDFARPGVLSLRPGSFRGVAERSLLLVRHEISRKQIEVVEAWCETEPPLRLDRNKMEQVLVNVFLNAVQATPVGGTLTLATSTDANGFKVEIDDTGTGISVENRKKLFEPFFTTKPPGQGTGLGLSVARQIVELHGGTLRLANRPDGRGARVSIQIPFAS